MKDAKLLKFATAFREGMIGKRKGASENACFMVSAPLAGLLQAQGVDCELVESDLGEINHVWIRLADGRALDPTADQFNRSSKQQFPPVYLGPPATIHTVPRHTSTHLDRERATT